MKPYATANAVVTAFLTSYFTARDVSGVLDCVSASICWTGTSDEERVTGREALRVMLEADMTEQREPYLFGVTEQVDQKLSDTSEVKTLTGWQRVGEYSMPMRATLCCVNTAEGWKIENVHASVANRMQENGEFYPHHSDDWHYEHFRREMFDTLFTDENINDGINAALARIGGVCGVSRVYIFENNEDDTCTSNTFEWCADGIPSEKDHLQNISYADMGGNYIEQFDADGMFYCPDIASLPEAQRAVLEPQGIVSMLQCAIIEENRFRGFIGFDICAGTEECIDMEKVEILAYLSRLISASLLRERHYQKLALYQTELEGLLAAKEALRREATEANQAKSDFLARMSHDMRTPLNGILGTVRLALSEDPPEAFAEPFRDVLSSGEFLLSLINDVLDMSKIEKGKIELHPEPYPYQEFIRNITKMIAPLCRDKNITLEMNPLDGNTSVLVDKIRFRQIFFNIFSNAVKYTPSGGTVSHYTEILSLDDHHLSCRCHVIDTGIGMSEEFQQHLFEPFRQEHQEEYANIQGTGLGMAIANNLAHAMGGDLTVKSTLGKGTEVVIDVNLPVVSAAEKDAVAKKVRLYAPNAFDGRRILLCEDHPLNAKIAIRLLEKVGCAVDWKTDGASGVEAFGASAVGQYDAVLMDIRMPGMDGLSACEAIRTLDRPDAAAVPVIAMTANAFEEDRRATAAAGMNAHVAKPVDPQELYRVLDEYWKIT